MNWFGFVPGKRESRRFLGQHILNQNELEKSVPFEDAIAYGGWAMDLHPPEGVDAPHLRACTQYGLDKIYDIPLRSCVSRNVENLMFAGRNISATHIAFGSTRVMATCGAIGQGVGVSAHVAAREGISPAQMAGNADAIEEIHQALLKQDAYLIGIQNRDEDDLALKADVSASSSTQEGSAGNVLSGQTRSVHGKDGAQDDRARPGLHRWMSDPDQGFPSWLELSWKEAVSIQEVRLVFDTGMHRELTLSYANSTNRKIIWGSQPETVKDYDLQYLENGEWENLKTVRDNYQRHQIHSLEQAVKSDKIRVSVHATNGVPEARIFEVRVYKS